MAASLQFQGAEDILKFYALLKDIPMSKVIRNASRDALQAAYRHTPETGRVSKSPWALLPGHGKASGRGVYVRLTSQSGKDQRRLSAYRLHKPMRGFALAAFIPAWRQLLPEKKPSKAANFQQASHGWSFFANRSNPYKDSFKPGIEGFRRAHTAQTTFSGVETRQGDVPSTAISVTEKALDRYPGWAEEAASAGYRLAAERMLKDLNRLLEHPEQIKP